MTIPRVYKYVCYINQREYMHVGIKWSDEKAMLTRYIGTPTENKDTKSNMSSKLRSAMRHGILLVLTRDRRA